MTHDQLVVAFIVGLYLAGISAPALAGWYSVGTVLFLIGVTGAQLALMSAWPVLMRLI